MPNHKKHAEDLKNYSEKSGHNTSYSDGGKRGEDKMPDEADFAYAASQSPKSKTENAVEAIGDILTMGSVSRMNKAQDKKDREEFRKNYKKKGK